LVLDQSQAHNWLTESQGLTLPYLRGGHMSNTIIQYKLSNAYI